MVQVFVGWHCRAGRAGQPGVELQARPGPAEAVWQAAPQISITVPHCSWYLRRPFRVLLGRSVSLSPLSKDPVPSSTLNSTLFSLAGVDLEICHKLDTGQLPMGSRLVSRSWSTLPMVPCPLIHTSHSVCAAAIMMSTSSHGFSMQIPSSLIGTYPGSFLVDSMASHAWVPLPGKAAAQAPVQLASSAEKEPGATQA